MDDQTKSPEGQMDQLESGNVMTFRLQIPNALVGSVIGKQGDSIKAIREQSHAKVNIGDSQATEDRDITIKGTLQSVDQAVNMIIANICQTKSQSFPPGQPVDDTISVKVLVANDQAGAIIGKGGEVIKQLRDESGARISIGKRVEYIRTIAVSGNVNAVRSALSVLIRTVHDHPSSARDPFAHSYRAQPTYRMNQPAFNYPSQIAYGLPQSNQVVAPGMIEHSIYPNDATPNTLTLSVPNRTVGAIIGKRGQTINEIRTLSGCRVDIANQVEGSQFRTITLTGNSHSIEVAHLLIQKFFFGAPYQP
jgi:predicted RNA-binding protein YlqC (UPF0109 family)